MCSCSSCKLKRAADKMQAATLYFYRHPFTGQLIVGADNGKSYSGLVRIGVCDSVCDIAATGYRFIHLSL